MPRSTQRLRAQLVPVVAALAMAGAGAAGVVAGSEPAAAATAASPAGHLARVFQHRDRTVTISGFGYDRNHPRHHPTYCVAVAGSCIRWLHPRRSSPWFNRTHHIVGTGGHRFVTTVGPLSSGVVVTLRGFSSGRAVRVDRQAASTPGHRVIGVARHFVGGNYTYGGSSPGTGFDCSGYTMYSYAHGQTARLPHNADGQRRLRSMHRIVRSRARPGDLIFYMSGARAVHVAIFAGHGYQYSATNEQQGIRYQRIYSRNVIFKTDWHQG